MSLRRGNEISEFESCIEKTQKALDLMQRSLDTLKEKGAKNISTGEMHEIAAMAFNDMKKAQYPWLSFMNRD